MCEIKLEGDLCNYVKFRQEFTTKLDLSDAQSRQLVIVSYLQPEEMCRVKRETKAVERERERKAHSYTI